MVQGYDGDVVIQRIGSRTRIDDPYVIQMQIRARRGDRPGHRWCVGKFEIHPKSSTLTLKKQVNLCTCVGLPEVDRFGIQTKASDRLLQGKSFPGRAQNRVGYDFFLGLQREEAVKDTAVADVQFGSFNKSFPKIGCPRTKGSENKCVDQKIDPARHRRLGNHKAAGYRGEVGDATVVVRDHRP